MLQEKCTVFIVLECTGEDELYKESPLAVLTSEQAAEEYIQKRKLERIEISDYLQKMDRKYVKEIAQKPFPGLDPEDVEEYNAFLMEIEAKYNPEYERLTHGDFHVGYAHEFQNEKIEYKIISCHLFE